MLLSSAYPVKPGYRMQSVTNARHEAKMAENNGVIYEESMKILCIQYSSFFRKENGPDMDCLAEQRLSV